LQGQLKQQAKGNRWIGQLLEKSIISQSYQQNHKEKLGNKSPVGKGDLACLERLLRNIPITCHCSHHHEAFYLGRGKTLKQTTNSTLTTTAKETI
jgi:hypothetical protein